MDSQVICRQFFIITNNWSTTNDLVCNSIPSDFLLKWIELKNYYILWWLVSFFGELTLLYLCIRESWWYFLDSCIFNNDDYITWMWPIFSKKRRRNSFVSQSVGFQLTNRKRGLLTSLTKYRSWNNKTIRRSMNVNQT